MKEKLVFHKNSRNLVPFLQEWLFQISERLSIWFNYRILLETGWTPNAKLAKLISPILNYLLPILIGHTGGKMFGGDRGGVIGALVTMGAIVAVDGTPMFLAAMILGPVAGVCIKKFDQAVDGKIPSGFRNDRK